MMLSAIHGDDWFSRSDPFMTAFGDMENEIAELRTLTKVTRLRQQIECRHEGEWLVVRDVPDEKSKGGTRKVTAYGRATRSVTRSVSQHVDFNGHAGLFNGGLDKQSSSHRSRNDFGVSDQSGPVVVEFPDEPTESVNPKSEVEIVEIASESVKSPIPFDEKVPENKSSPAKKTSVVTLGKGNLVFIDSEDSDSHFQVTGISKGKVADVVSTLERVSAEDKNQPRKLKKVGFSKTEVHFAPDSGRVKIVETDEKPPPTQLLRKKRRPKSFPERSNKSNFPKLYFGDEEKQQFSSESNIKTPTEHVFPVLREPSPLLSTKDILNPLKSASQPLAASPTNESWSSKPSFVPLSVDRSSPEPKINNYLKRFSTSELECRLAEPNDTKPNSNNVYLGKVSPKLSKLLQNSMQHEFQLKHFQIVGKKDEDQPSPIQSFVSIKLEPDSSKLVSQVQLESMRPTTKTPETPRKAEPLYINREVIVPESRRSTSVTTVKDKTPKPKPRTSITKITNNASVKVTSTQISDDSKKVRNISRNPTPDLRRSVTPSSHTNAQIVKKEVAEVKPLKSYTRNTVSRQSEVCRKSYRSRTESTSAPNSIAAVHRSSTSKATAVESNAVVSGGRSASSKKTREPLRSFEKVSNGWVGHCIVPIKSTTVSSPGANVSITANIYATPSASAKPSGPKRSTASTEAKTGHRSAKEDKQSLSTSFPANRQFSLSKEHLKSAKLVKELVTKDTPEPVKGVTATTRVTAAKPKVNVVRPRVIDSTRRHSGVTTTTTSSTTTGRGTPASRTTPTNNKTSTLNRRRFHLEDNYGRLRRDSERSDDSVVRADEEVRAYMLNTRHKMKSGDLLDEMSASYSEICDAQDVGEEEEELLVEKVDDIPLERPRALPLSDRLSRLEGVVTRQGDMITFVANDLETKIKLSSPNSCSDRPWSPRGAAGLLEDLEVEASALAASVDSLAEALSETLHGISALTVDCLETYRDVVCKTCDSVDANIKAMYQLMAKCEEISKSMAPIYKLSAHIKQIKHVLDLLEASPG